MGGWWLISYFGLLRLLIIGDYSDYDGLMLFMMFTVGVALLTVASGIVLYMAARAYVKP